MGEAGKVWGREADGGCGGGVRDRRGKGSRYIGCSSLSQIKKNERSFYGYNVLQL